MVTIRKTLESSKLKVHADKNGRKFSKGVENTVGKVEIALHLQFFLFPWCFQKNCSAGLFGKGPNEKILDRLKLKDDKINVTENLEIVLAWVGNIVGKVENAVYQHFLPSMFSNFSFSGLFKHGMM